MLARLTPRRGLLHIVQICTPCNNGRTLVDVTETLGRRELNKTRTREAIVAALRTLVAEQPMSEVTVDQLAEAAGISRRTFFNYFPNTIAVLSQTFAELAGQMLSQVDGELLRTDPVAAVRTLVKARGVSPELLSWLAALNCHQRVDEADGLIERAVWAELAAWLQEVLVDELPEGSDPLYVSTLASAVMGTFSAAERPWLAALEGRSALSQDDVDHFHDHLDRALGYLARGLRVG